MTVVVVEPAAVSVGREGGGGSGLIRRRNERGMVSAEWAVGILAAIAIAGVLLAVVTDGQVQDALLQFILFVINKFSGMAGGE